MENIYVLYSKIPVILLKERFQRKKTLLYVVIKITIKKRIKYNYIWKYIFLKRYKSNERQVQFCLLVNTMDSAALQFHKLQFASEKSVHGWMDEEEEEGILWGQRDETSRDRLAERRAVADTDTVTHRLRLDTTWTRQWHAGTRPNRLSELPPALRFILAHRNCTQSFWPIKVFQ